MIPTRAVVEDPGTALVTRQRRAFVVLAVLSLLHILAVWGYTGVFWGDHGRWLHEVSRFAAGETPYRDFSWNGPPLSLWLLGGVARFTGSNLAAISVTTSIVFLAIVIVYLALLRRFAPDLVFAIALPVLLFAAAYAHRSGVALPLGTSTPGGPVGFMFLLGAALAVLSLADKPGWGAALAAGVLAGLAMLSRSDYWLTGPYLVAAATWILARRGANKALALTPAIALLLTSLSGLLLAASSAGTPQVVGMIGATLRGLVLAVLSPPGFERLTIDIAAVAAVGLTAVTALWLCLAISDRAAGRWFAFLMCVFLTASAVHLGRSLSIARELQATGPEPVPTLSEDALYFGLQSGRGALGSAVAFFDERLQSHLFPYLLPPLLLLTLVVRWNRWNATGLRNLLAPLLGLCLVARAHRPSLGPDWNNVFLELPTYALFFRLLCGTQHHKAARAIRAALSILILLGAFTYISLARGPLTLTGTYAPLRTTQGTVHWPQPAVAAWGHADSAVRAIDPGGTRPVYASGLTGGWNYFLGRRNPVPFTGGLATSSIDPDSILARLRASRPPVILIENRFGQRAVPSMGSMRAVFRWEPTSELGSFATSERTMFRRLEEQCTAADADTTLAVRVFDCH